MKLKKKNKKVIGVVIFIIVLFIFAILFSMQLGFLAIITGSAGWVDQESYVTLDGEWSTQHPVTNAFDEDWNTATVLHTTYKEANIYEHFILDYPQNVIVDYLEFQVKYDITHIPEVGKDVYSWIKHYVWNYRTSSWDKIHEESSDTNRVTKILKVSAIDHIQNKEVRLRTEAGVGFLQVVWVFEAKARLSYSKEVDCNIGETKCWGFEDREYFTCSQDYIWENQGMSIGKCNVECISKLDCSQDLKCSNNKCISDIESYYRFLENKCNLISLLPSEKTLNDYNTLEQCQEKISPKITVYKIINNTCQSYEIYENEKTEEYLDTLEECNNLIQKPVEEPKEDEEDRRINIPFILSLIVIILIVIGFIFFLKKKK